MGVHNPMRRNIPAIAASTFAMAAVIDPWSTAPIAPNIKAPPRKSRRIKSPAPGGPSANVEKRRRTTLDITEFAAQPESPKGSLRNPLLGVRAQPSRVQRQSSPHEY